MSSDIAIEVNSLSKCYQLYDSPADRMKQSFLGRLSKTPYYKEFWALKDISFQVKRGEAFAVIGRNGAGKSTLLQLIAGTLRPTSGKIFVNGRVGALLELGSGFNPEFTGTENVFLNGAISGFSKAQIELLYDKIVEFADIGSFIDRPIKTYSSGMIVRLAFAVQAFTNPEILIVDEALSVGDLFFAQKCARLMQEMRERGTTILFVSHDMSSVRNMCSRAAYLKQGLLVECGPTQQVVRDYYREGSPKEESNLSDGLLLENSLAKIIACRVENEFGEETQSIQMGKIIRVKIKWQAHSALSNVHCSLTLKNKLDQVVFCGGSFNQNLSSLSVSPEQQGEFFFEIKCDLEAGRYAAWLNIGEADYAAPTHAKAILEFALAEPVTITWDYENSIPPFYGMVGLPYTVKNHLSQD